jgi:hypothetical protein
MKLFASCITNAENQNEFQIQFDNTEYKTGNSSIKKWQ